MSTASRPSLAQTACLHCRSQKLRCSRELPQCARCTRLNEDCTFPEPPDRRLIAVCRESRKRRDANDRPVREEDRPNKREHTAEHPRTNPAPPYQHSQQYQATESNASWSVSALDPAVQQVFLDTYFSCTFNSSLIFHRPTFEKDYANGDVPEQLLQALCAMATCFLSPSSSNNRQDAKLQSLGDAKALGLSWAKEAGRTALQSIDEPALSALQTCLILALFWFSHGNVRRNTMFVGIAYRAACCMAQDLEQEMNALDQKQGYPRWLEFEQLRRCFWAAWQIRNVNYDHYAIGGSSGPSVMAMLLPASEEAFNHGEWERSGTLANRSQQQAFGVMAESMRLVQLWGRVRAHLDARRSDTKPEAWNDAYVLYNELAQWERQLHPSLDYSKRNLYELLVVKQQPVCLLVYTMYYQCCLVLQASLIPSLSGSLNQEKTPPQVVRVSTEIVLDHAQALSRLATDLLALDWEPTRIAPFVGYSMYVAAAVYLTVMGQDSVRVESARQHLVPCLQLLKNMKPYWAILDRLWDRLQLLHEMRITKTSNEPLTQSSDAANTLRCNSVGDQTAQDADAHSVNEVLNDSVLYFSPRGLSRNPIQAGNTGNSLPNTSELDRILGQSSQDQLSNLLGRDHSDVSQREDQNTLASCSTTLQPIPQNDNISPALTSNAENQSTVSSAANLQAPNNLENWWESYLTTDFQANLSFDDLFGMDLTVQ